MLVQLFSQPIESEKAYFLTVITGATKLNAKEFWAPKSQVRLVSADGLDYHGGEIFADMPAWLAKKHGIRG